MKEIQPSGEDVFIVFNDGSKRSQGYFDLLSTFDNCYMVILSDEMTNLDDGNYEKVDCSNSDEIGLVSEISNIIDRFDGIINIDVSPLNRVEFLYFLRVTELVGRYDDLRILYTEPSNYLTGEHQVPSIGIERISSVPGYLNRTPLNKPLLLILLLGFEPSRSMAIYNNIDPDRTLLIIPNPPYNPSWWGRTEEKNSELIQTISDKNIYNMHSRDIKVFQEQFENMIVDQDLDLTEWNSRISPLSTKPQSLAIFEFWRDHKGLFSLIHSTPLKRSELFKPTGIGEKHILKEPN